MKNRLKLAVIVILATYSVANAQIKATGHGSKTNFDPSSIPVEYTNSFKLMQKKCIKCHNMERTVVGVITGKSLLSGTPFTDNTIKLHAIKLLRDPDSGLIKPELLEITSMLNNMLLENRKKR